MGPPRRLFRRGGLDGLLERHLEAPFVPEAEFRKPLVGEVVAADLRFVDLGSGAEVLRRNLLEELGIGEAAFFDSLEGDADGERILDFAGSAGTLIRADFVEHLGMLLGEFAEPLLGFVIRCGLRVENRLRLVIGPEKRVGFVNRSLELLGGFDRHGWLVCWLLVVGRW